MEILTKLSTSHRTIWTSRPLDKTFPCAHCVRARTHTAMIAFSSASLSCMVAMAMNGPDFNRNKTLHRSKTQKNIMITSDYISETLNFVLLSSAVI